jgi:hypothetical protein
MDPVKDVPFRPSCPLLADRKIRRVNVPLEEAAVPNTGEEPTKGWIEPPAKLVTVKVKS